MTIGVDADGILFDYVGDCALVVNLLFGAKIASIENCKYWDNLKSWGCEHLKEQVDNWFASPGIVRNMTVIPDAKYLIEQLRYITKGDFVVITSCPPTWHKERAEALQELGVSKYDICFSYKKNLFNVDALIDDCPNNFVNFKGRRLLRDRPWNRITDIELERCLTTDHLLSAVESIYKNHDRNILSRINQSTMEQQRDHWRAMSTLSGF